MSSTATINKFVPARHLDGGHRMTLFTWARTRNFPSLPAPTCRYFNVADDTQVLAHCHWQKARHERPTLIALHGLEGSSAAHYMRGLADKSYRAGFNAILLNQRNCGNTEHLSKGLYHSGLSVDPANVIRELVEVDELTDIVVVGYSLGGNLGLKLAGAYGHAPPAAVKAVCAVSPTMDLAICVDALEKKENALYQWNFVRNLKRRMRRKAQALPGLFNLKALNSVRTVRDFDNAYTAPHHGFKDAADYYHQASSLRVIDRISIPTLIISAIDDPFIPSEQFDNELIKTNPRIMTAISQHGGHCGFLAHSLPGFDGYWAERRAVDFAIHHLPQSCDVSRREQTE